MQVRDWLRGRYIGNAKEMCLLSLGAKFSGKSYTMFGDPQLYEERGVIPRLFEEIFDSRTLAAHCVKLSMYIIEREHIVDMLTVPCKRYAHESCVTESTSLGAIVLDVQEVVCRNSTDAIATIECGLKMLSHYISARTTAVLCDYQTMLQVQWLGPPACALPNTSPWYPEYVAATTSAAPTRMNSMFSPLSPQASVASLGNLKSPGSVVSQLLNGPAPLDPNVPSGLHSELEN